MHGWGVVSKPRDVRRHAEKARGEARTAGATTESPADDRLAGYVGDPVGFFEALTNPETNEPFVVYPAERTFLETALTLIPEGTAPYPELVYSAPKKSGKTTLAAVVVLYVVRVLGGRFAEGYCVANDFDQAQGRVFQQCVRIIEASPLLRGTAKVTADTITFPDTGATITALPADYAGAAGANPSITVFDELWGYVSESASRLWDEMVPVPTRNVSVRLTVTYAGFEGESTLLEELHDRGVAGEEIAPRLFRSPDLLCFWSHDLVAPWQTEEWVEQMRRTLRASAFTRMILNRFTAGESGFVELDWWDGCVDTEVRPVVAYHDLPVWVGIDASVKRDASALVAVTWDAATRRVRLVAHAIFRPTPEEPIDFEDQIEATVLDFAARFRLEQALYDPYQMVASAQRLVKAGLPLEEFPQSVPNLTAASQNLYDLIKGRNLAAYPDAEIRTAVGHAVAIEGVRGWRIAKEKARNKIDVVVALAMACLACVRAQGTGSAVDMGDIAEAVGDINEEMRTRGGYSLEDLPAEADIPSRQDFGLSPSRRETFPHYSDTDRRRW